MLLVKLYISVFIGISIVNIIFSAPIIRGDNVRLDYLIKEIFHIPSVSTNNGVSSGISKTAVFSPINRPLISRVPRENVDKQQENVCINFIDINYV